MPKRKEEPSIKQWMPVYIRDYLADTCALTTEQHGAYFLLLMEYWIRGGPIRNNDGELSSITRLSIDKWKRIKPQIISYFYVNDGFLHHKRADREIFQAKEFLEKKRKASSIAANKRWHPDDSGMQAASEPHPSGIPSGMPQGCTHTHTSYGHVYTGNGGDSGPVSELYLGGRT